MIEVVDSLSAFATHWILHNELYVSKSLDFHPTCKRPYIALKSSNATLSCVFSSSYSEPSKSGSCNKLVCIPSMIQHICFASDSLYTFSAGLNESSSTTYSRKRNFRCEISNERHIRSKKKGIMWSNIKVLKFQLTCRLHTVELIDNPIYTDQGCARKLLSLIRINSQLYCFTKIPHCVHLPSCSTYALSLFVHKQKICPDVKNCTLQ